MFRPADLSDLARLRRPLLASGLFRDLDEIEAYRERGPWRLLVTDVGEVAVVDRWREHLRFLAIRVLLCPEGRIPDLVRVLGAVARERSLEALLSPLLDRPSTRPYAAAGMRSYQEVVSMSIELSPSMAGGIAETAVIPGSVDDTKEVLSLDARCFDPFWRFDAESLGDLLRTERLALVREAGVLLGYSLSSVRVNVGVLGRVAVGPDARGRGVGRRLVRDALASMSREGAARMVLCTQAENRASRRLYRSEGLREASARLCMLVSDTL